MTTCSRHAHAVRTKRFLEWAALLLQQWVRLHIHFCVHRVQVPGDAVARQEAALEGGLPWLLSKFLAASKRHRSLAAAELAAKGQRWVATLVGLIMHPSHSHFLPAKIQATALHGAQPCWSSFGANITPAKMKTACRHRLRQATIFMHPASLDAWRAVLGNRLACTATVLTIGPVWRSHLKKTSGPVPISAASDFAFFAQSVQLLLRLLEGDADRSAPGAAEQSPGTKKRKRQAEETTPGA